MEHVTAQNADQHLKGYILNNAMVIFAGVYLTLGSVLLVVVVRSTQPRPRSAVIVGYAAAILVVSAGLGLLLGT